MYLKESLLGSCQRLCQIHLLDAMYLKESIERIPAGVLSTSMLFKEMYLKESIRDPCWCHVNVYTRYIYWMQCI
jgi:hypothetical protein